MLNPDFKDMLCALNDEDVEYLVVGAYAMAVYGLPRATGDLDLWVNPTPQNAERAWRALGRFGAPLDRLTLEDLQEPGLVYQIGVAPVRIDVLTAIDGVDFPSAWADKTVVEVDGVRIHVIGLDALIANKTAVGRAQDVADVERLRNRER